MLRYLKGTIELGLVYGGNVAGGNLEGFVDASFADDTHQRKSTTGYVFIFNGAAISWSSKLQSLVALSSQEAEYIAACAATREASHLRALLQDIGLDQEEATYIGEDNMACIKLAETTGLTDRTKHIAVQFHYVREKVQRKEIKLVHVPTARMVADALTKNLGRIKFGEHRCVMLGNME